MGPIRGLGETKQRLVWSLDLDCMSLQYRSVQADAEGDAELIVLDLWFESVKWLRKDNQYPCRSVSRTMLFFHRCLSFFPA
jgi:hypothetical protein